MGAVIAVSGSPRRGGNTDLLLAEVLAVCGGELVRICDLDVAPCTSCWCCLQQERCVLNDDMTALTARLLSARAILLGTPVYFNNVSAQLKAFMDRTWALRGKLSDKIGAAVVVGRGYGSEGALTAINSFFLKHEMIVAQRGVSGEAFDAGTALQDRRAVEDCAKLGGRIAHLLSILPAE